MITTEAPLISHIFPPFYAFLLPPIYILKDFISSPTLLSFLEYMSYLQIVSSF